MIAHSFANGEEARYQCTKLFKITNLVFQLINLSFKLADPLVAAIRRNRLCWMWY